MHGLTDALTDATSQDAPTRHPHMLPITILQQAANRTFCAKGIANSHQAREQANGLPKAIDIPKAIDNSTIPVGGGGRPSQLPADDLEHQFALGPVLSRLLRSIGRGLGANTSLLLHIGVRIVQEILQGERSRRSVNQGASAAPV